MVKYKSKIEDGLYRDCELIIELINSKVLSKNCIEESKAFFVKMVGDYYRYIAETAKGEKFE